MTTTPTLADWLDTLRARRIVIDIGVDGPTLTGANVTHLDHAWLHRHHRALLVAAAGTHPDWWHAIVERRLDQLHADDAPEGCAVAGCPGDLEHYSPEAIPFCANHHPDWWLADLPVVDHQEQAA